MKRFMRIQQNLCGNWVLIFDLEIDNNQEIDKKAAIEAILDDLGNVDVLKLWNESKGVRFIPSQGPVLVEIIESQ